MYTFKLTEEETNRILFLLAKEPYADVVDLIGKIHEQAEAQTEKLKE